MNHEELAERPKIAISDDFFMNEQVYLCPFCKYPFTHHGKIEIFGRAEDDRFPNHVTVEDYHVSVDREDSGNPSGRRGGISIKFWCENCMRVHYITIAQHKGVTLLNIVDRGEKVSAGSVHPTLSIHDLNANKG